MSKKDDWLNDLVGDGVIPKKLNQGIVPAENTRINTGTDARKIARIDTRINTGTNARKNARKRLRHEDIYEQHTVYYEHKLWELVKNSGETITYEINEALRQYYGVEE